MSSMFDNASKFNKDIINWDTSNVTTMSCMFSHAHKFIISLLNTSISNHYRFNF
jgi:surface protein